MNYSRLLKFAAKFNQAAFDAAYEEHLASRLNSEEGVTVIKDELAQLSIDSTSLQDAETKLSKLAELLDLANDLSMPMAVANSIQAVIDREKVMIDAWKIHESSDRILNELMKTTNPTEKAQKAGKYEELLLRRMQKTDSARAAEIIQEVLNQIIDLKNEGAKERAEYLAQQEAIDALGNEIRRQRGDIKKNPKTDKFTVFKGY
jgi:hypothetical protein